MITVLAGGVGAARMLRGILLVAPGHEVTAVVNVGDDIQQVLARMGNGLSVCLFHGPGARSCRFGNGLLLVADPDGVVRLVA